MKYIQKRNNISLQCMVIYEILRGTEGYRRKYNEINIELVFGRLE